MFERRVDDYWKIKTRKLGAMVKRCIQKGGWWTRKRKRKGTRTSTHTNAPNTPSAPIAKSDSEASRKTNRGDWETGSTNGIDKDNDEIALITREEETGKVEKWQNGKSWELYAGSSGSEKRRVVVSADKIVHTPPSPTTTTTLTTTTTTTNTTTTAAKKLGVDELDIEADYTQ